MDVGVDGTLRGDAARLLVGGRHALLAEPLDSLVHVAVALGEGLLAEHHAGARLVAEFLHSLGGDGAHLSPRGCAERPRGAERTAPARGTRQRGGRDDRVLRLLLRPVLHHRVEPALHRERHLARALLAPIDDLVRARRCVEQIFELRVGVPGAGQGVDGHRGGLRRRRDFPRRLVSGPADDSNR